MGCGLKRELALGVQGPGVDVSLFQAAATHNRQGMCQASYICFGVVVFFNEVFFLYLLFLVAGFPRVFLGHDLGLSPLKAARGLAACGAGFVAHRLGSAQEGAELRVRPVTLSGSPSINMYTSIYVYIYTQVYIDIKY